MSEYWMFEQQAKYCAYNMRRCFVLFVKSRIYSNNNKIVSIVRLFVNIHILKCRLLFEDS